MKQLIKNHNSEHKGLTEEAIESNWVGRAEKTSSLSR